MTSDLKGKTAIVTGAGRGLGREYAQKFAAARANVVAVNVLDYADTVAAIKAAGGDAISVPLDVRDQAMASFGRIDVLVNKAAP